jgi:hypothetical protein
MASLFHHMIRRIRGYDRYTLTPFEEAAFSGIAEQHVPNVAFLSLRLQLHEWLRVRSVKKIPGAPSWWQRSFSGPEVTLAQQRIVGGLYTLPKEACPVEFVFQLTAPTVGSIDSTIIVNESVRSVCLLFPNDLGREYPDVDQVQPDPLQLDDDRVYWGSVQTTNPVLKSLLEGVLTFIDQILIPDRPTVVLPVRTMQECRSIAGIATSGSYGRLLEISNGIRVNHTVVWGNSGGRERLRVVEGQQYLLIGDDGSSLLALKVNQGAVGDDVWAFSSLANGRPRRLGGDVLALCKDALQG